MAEIVSIDDVPVDVIDSLLADSITEGPVDNSAELESQVLRDSIDYIDPIDEEFPSYADLSDKVRTLTEQLSARDRLESDISAESQAVDRAASEVLRCEGNVEEAKGDLKAAKERYDKRVNALRDLVRDMTIGQGRLEFDAVGTESDATTTVPVTAPMNTPPTEDPAATAPVCELGKKLLRKAVGAEVFDRAKDSEEPIGLTDKQLEVIEGTGCTTIADLERKLRQYSFFLQDLKGFGEQTQNRLTASLMAWRGAFPHVSAE